MATIYVKVKLVHYSFYRCYNFFMKKLLFIINPNSGKKGSKADLIEALNIFSKNGYKVEVYCTQAQNDCFEKICKVGQKYDVVVVSGGDGTLNETTNGLMYLDEQSRPLIGYIPTGTMNDFSKNFDLSSDFKESALKIIGGRTDVFDIGRINRRYFNYVAGFGAFTRVSYETERDLKENIGDIAYLISGLGELGNLHPTHVKMEADGQTIEKDLLLGLIVNGYKVSGMDMVQKEEGIMKDGYFDVILVEWSDNILDWIRYPIGLLNPQIQEKSVQRIRAKRIHIETDSPIEWTIDGERGEATTVADVINVERPLKILY